ncbi:MAG: SDR family oxidoreductase [Vicinamibacterales bacterium]
MRVLVTGASGLLGSTVAREFASDAVVESVTHRDLDITDPAAVSSVVDRVSPGVIVNCAAYNDVDAAEGHAPDAMAVNAFGVLALARAARAAGAVFVHYSSDFVFDGEAARPYTEDDRPRPRSVYAATKLLGEWFAAEAPRHYVLRVESLFGPPADAGRRRGSLGTIVDGIRRGDVVPVFVDRTVSPSYTVDVASATRRVIEASLPPGVYHCVNDGAPKWNDVAAEAARLLGLSLQMRELTLESASLPAARPRYCALSPSRLAASGIRMPTWQDALARYLNPSSLIPHR